MELAYSRYIYEFDTYQECMRCGNNIEFEFDDYDEYGNNLYTGKCNSCNSIHRIYPVKWKFILEK